ncbi:hypothetical protein [Pyrodictium abyssi]|uniref:Uncharacterized protein n=1 Tax=Pyrodictium abyssi TaxID=54256 RepID=A0ABN6ZVG0_9CREN|nr:hypothetical protein PABY_21640 [Pyrodictium abyssi]
MATEAQKVIPRDAKTPGAQEMSLSVARAVDSILDILRGLAPHERILALKEVEARIRPTASEEEIVRKVSRYGRIYAVYVRASLPDGEYKVRTEAKRAIYEPVYENGDVKVRRDRKSSLRIPIPKWVYEALGEPLFVRIRIEGSRIVVEPA